ncbi:MAG: hypothetical protein KBT07_01825 [Clostridiales bacterium]|nr:hypothetical protein [Candidatus Scatonaster coprocaballi]
MPDPSLEKPKLDLKKMGFKKAVIHLWTYYKWWVIIPIIVLIIIGSFIHSYLTATKKGYLNIVLVNARYECSEVMFADYAEQIGEKIIVQSDYVVPDNDDSIDVSQEMIANQQKLVTSLTEGVIDICITNSRAISEYGENGVLDLRLVLSEEQIQDLEERDMIYYMDFEAEEHVPIAINVTGLPYFEPAYEGSEEKHYLFLSKYSDKYEEEKLLLEFLFF